MTFIIRINIYRYLRSIILITIAIMANIGCEAEKTDDMPIEQKLAIIDATTFVDTTDIKVIRIKTLLNDLAKKYNQPIDTIAEYTSKAQGVLHDQGIQESCLDILENIRKAGKMDNTPYKDAITLYLMYRTNQ